VFRPSFSPCHYPDFVVVGDFIEVSAPHVAKPGEGDTFKTAHFHAKPNTDNKTRIAYIRCGNAEVSVVQDGAPVAVEPEPKPIEPAPVVPVPAPQPPHVHPEPTPVPVTPAPIPTPEPPHVHPEPAPIPVVPTPTPEPPHVHPQPQPAPTEPVHVHPQPLPVEPAPVPVVGKSSLQRGEQIVVGESLTSADGRISLTIENDGRLALRTVDLGGFTLWQSNKTGKGPFRLTYQTDGHLVLYDGDQKPLWYSNVHGAHVAGPVIENSGNFVVKDVDGKVLWQTDTTLLWYAPHVHHHEEVPFGTIRPDTTTPTIRGHHGDEMYNFAIHADENVRDTRDNYKPNKPNTCLSVRSGGKVVIRERVDFKELTADGGEIVFEDGANVTYETFQGLKGSRVVFRPANKGIRISHKPFMFRPNDKNEFGGGSIFMCEVDIRGKKTRRYIAVAKGPMAKDEWIELAEPALDWEVGHEVIVPGTKQGGSVVPGTNLKTLDDHEERTILELSADRKKIRVRPLEFDHPGCFDRGLNKWVNPSIGNMFASIVITSEGDVPYHNMFTGGIKGVIDSVRFEGGSRTGMTLSGDGHIGFKGRYGGTHVHGNDIPGAFKVTNCVYKDVNKWSIVNHGGKGVDFEYNLVVQGKGSSGSLMVGEDGTETGNFAYNMLVGVKGLGLTDGHDRMGVAGTCIWLNGAGIKVIGNQGYGGLGGMTLYNGVNAFHPEPYLGRDCVWFRQDSAARVFSESGKPGPELATVTIGGFTAVHCNYGHMDGSYVFNFAGIRNARFLFDPTVPDSTGWGIWSNRGRRFIENYFQDCPKGGGAIYFGLAITEDLTRELIRNTGNSLGHKIRMDNIMHYQTLNGVAYLSDNDIKGEQEDISYSFLNFWGNPGQMFDMAPKADNPKPIFVYNNTVEPRGRFELLSEAQLGDWRPDLALLFESSWSDHHVSWTEAVVPAGPVNSRGMVEVELDAAFFGNPGNDWNVAKTIQRLVKRTDPDEEPDVWEHVVNGYTFQEAHDYYWAKPENRVVGMPVHFRAGEKFEFAPGTVLRWGYSHASPDAFHEWRLRVTVADILNLPKYKDLAYANKHYGTSLGGRFAHRHEAITVPQLKTSVLVPSSVPEGVNPVEWWLKNGTLNIQDRAWVHISEKDSRLGAFRITPVKGNGNFAMMEGFQIWVSDKLEGDRVMIHDSGKRYHPYNQWFFLPPVVTTPDGKRIELGDGKERYYFFSRRTPDGKYRFTRKWHEWWDEKPRGRWRYVGGFKFKWTYDPATQPERVVKPSAQLSDYVFEGAAPQRFEHVNPEGKPWGKPLVYPIDDECVPILTWAGGHTGIQGDVDPNNLSQRVPGYYNYEGFAGYAYLTPAPGRRPLWQEGWGWAPAVFQVWDNPPTWYLPTHEEYQKSLDMFKRAQNGEYL
jgi:hypothetical protein